MTTTMNRLDDLLAIKPQVQYLRLKGVSLGVPSVETIAKAEETAQRNGNQIYGFTASLRLDWEPLSYNVRGVNGNVTSDFIDVSFRIDVPDLERVRTSGWLGIPDRKLIRVDEKLPPEAQRTPWARFRARTRDVLAIDIDIDGSITGKVGQPYSSAVGHVFEVTEGTDYFPKNVQGADGKWTEDKANPNRKFMHYPIRIDDSYVAPADVPVRIPRNESSEAGAVVDTDALRTANTDTLRAAVLDSGMVGMSSLDLTGMSKQVNFLARHMEDSENTIVFGTAELNNAANEGELVSFLESKGALTVGPDGKIS